MKTSLTKYLLKSCIVSLLFISCSSPQNSPDQEEWISLLNGQNLDNWIAKIQHYEPGVNFANTFQVEDSLLRVNYEGYGGDFGSRFGHLYYEEPFSYYHLVLEYRFRGELYPGSPSYATRNSGIMIHSQDPRTMPVEQNWPISIEMQFLAGLGDGNPRPTGNMCSPGTHIVYNGELDTRHCINSSSETYPIDQWIRAEVIVLGDSLVTHIIEGDTVLQYSQPQIGGGVVAGYDSTAFVEGKILEEGYIALQSEGQPIDFRNIKVLNLEGCMDPESANYKSYYVKHDPETCI